MPDAWRLFWAKTDRDGKLQRGPEWTHPLWAHLLDVANAAWVLWEHYLPGPLRAMLTRACGLPDEEAGRVLSLAIGLHDAGKASPGFQEGHRAPEGHPEPHRFTRERLASLGFHFPNYGRGDRVHHGFVTVPIVQDWNAQQGFHGATAQLLERVITFVGFHHGWLCGGETLVKAGTQAIRGNAPWVDAQRALLDAVVHAWGVARWPEPAAFGRVWPDWLVPFAGWATLADWIGSMAEHYPSDARDENRYPAPSAYIADSEAAARRAFEAVRLHEHAALAPAVPERLFSFSLNPLQERVGNLPAREAPTLTLIEAPTGEGKTEAAQLRTLARGRSSSGFYVGLPTQATADQAFQRFSDFLERAHDPAAGTAWTALLHGSADLSEALLQRLERQPDKDDEPGSAAEPLFDDVAGDALEGDGERHDETQAEVRASHWFQVARQGFLAPYGVGTVDQALLGALHSRWFFLRLFALAGKTVVFDEVHAYDLYMAEVFERLLQWLRAVGADVVLLSATLPTATRRRLLSAWGAESIEAEAAYPAVWHATPGERCEPVAGFPVMWTQEAVLERLFYDPAASDFVRGGDREAKLHAKFAPVLSRIRKALHDGAAVGVIVNTVERAQVLFRFLTEPGASALPLGPSDLHLLHARFPLDERKRREREAVRRFGRDPETSAPRRPGPALLIATQVAEQSLDLDFDLLITDLAPLDLLLQRAGRLHRDLRDEASRQRPPGYEQPRVVLLMPEPGNDGMPPHGEVAVVYQDLVQLRTWHYLEHGGPEGARIEGWHLPHDYRRLIEAIYPEGMADKLPPDGLSQAGHDRWRRAVDCWKREEGEAKGESVARTIAEPTEVRNLLRDLRFRDEDDPKAPQHRRAVTRLGDPTVTIVPLHVAGDQFFLDADLTTRAPFDALRSENARERREAVRTFLRRTIRLSSRGVVPAVLALAPPEAWVKATEKAPVLAHVRPLVFRDGCSQLSERHTLRLDPTLGLVIERG